MSHELIERTTFPAFFRETGPRGSPRRLLVVTAVEPATNETRASRGEPERSEEGQGAPKPSIKGCRARASAYGSSVATAPPALPRERGAASAGTLPPQSRTRSGEHATAHATLKRGRRARQEHATRPVGRGPLTANLPRAALMNALSHARDGAYAAGTCLWQRRACVRALREHEHDTGACHV